MLIYTYILNILKPHLFLGEEWRKRRCFVSRTF